MPRIQQQLLVRAPKALVFDLSRSIDLHQISTAQTQERAVAGCTSGLIGLNETVTWRARHFGIYQHLTSRISGFDFPHFFSDEQVSGAFESFHHEHHFADHPEGTLVTDIFEYKSPLGLLGNLADWLFLEHYMTRLLQKRNEIIKEFAETDKWKHVLQST